MLTCALTVNDVITFSASAKVLGSEEEYVEWHQAYMRALAMQGDEDKLRASVDIIAINA